MLHWLGWRSSRKRGCDGPPGRAYFRLGLSYRLERFHALREPMARLERAAHLFHESCDIERRHPAREHWRSHTLALMLAEAALSVTQIYRGEGRADERSTQKADKKPR